MSDETSKPRKRGRSSPPDGTEDTLGEQSFHNPEAPDDTELNIAEPIDKSYIIRCLMKLLRELCFFRFLSCFSHPLTATNASQNKSNGLSQDTEKSEENDEGTRSEQSEKEVCQWCFNAWTWWLINFTGCMLLFVGHHHSTRACWISAWASHHPYSSSNHIWTATILWSTVGTLCSSFNDLHTHSS